MAIAGRESPSGSQPLRKLVKRKMKDKRVHWLQKLRSSAPWSPKSTTSVSLPGAPREDMASPSGKSPVARPGDLGGPGANDGSHLSRRELISGDHHEEVLVPATEHLPAGVAVAGQVTTESGNRKQCVARRERFRKR